MVTAGEELTKINGSDHVSFIIWNAVYATKQKIKKKNRLDSTCYFLIQLHQGNKRRRYELENAISTSSNGTNAKGASPLLCDVREISSSCQSSTSPMMSSSGPLTPLLSTLLVTSESISIRLLDPAVVPLNLKAYDQPNWINNRKGERRERGEWKE